MKTSGRGLAKSALVPAPENSSTPSGLNTSGGATPCKPGARSQRANSFETASLLVGPQLAENVRKQWCSYRKRLKKCQKDFSSRQVHDLRVETRRLMARLVLLHYVLGDSTVDKAWRILKRRLKDLGKLRDAHVQLAFMNQKQTRFHDVVHFRRYLARRERALTKPAFKRVQRFRTGKLGRWLSAMRAKLRKNGDDLQWQHEMAQALWHATEKAFQETVRRRQAIDPRDMRTIHRTRVAYKKFRYMFESLPGSVGRPNRQRRTAMAAYQRRLGSIQDSEVLLGRIDKYLRERKAAHKHMKAFRQYLVRRRTRLVRAYLKSADAFLGFWPPPPQKNPRYSSAAGAP